MAGITNTSTYMMNVVTDSPNRKTHTTQRSSLADYVSRIMRDKGLTLQQVADRSQGLLKKPTVNDMKQGRTINPTIDSLRGLAKGLGRPEDEVFAVARGIKPETTAADDLAAMFKLFSQLPPEQQAVYRPMIEMLGREIEQYLADHPEKRILTDASGKKYTRRAPDQEVVITPREKRKKTG